MLLYPGVVAAALWLVLHSESCQKQKTTRGTYNLQIAKSKKKKILNIHQCFNFYWSQSTQKTPYEWFCSLSPVSVLPSTATEFYQVCDPWRERPHFLAYLAWPRGCGRSSACTFRVIIPLKGRGVVSLSCCVLCSQLGHADKTDALGMAEDQGKSLGPAPWEP